MTSSEEKGLCLAPYICACKFGVLFKHLPSRETPNSNHRDHNIHKMSVLHSENSPTAPTGRAEPELASKVLGSGVLKEPTHRLCGGKDVWQDLSTLCSDKTEESTKLISAPGLSKSSLLTRNPRRFDVTLAREGEQCPH